MPVFVGSGLGVELDTATKTTNAITMTVASALTMIQGSLDEAGLAVGTDTSTPQRKSPRKDADRVPSVLAYTFSGKSSGPAHPFVGQPSSGAPGYIMQPPRTISPLATCSKASGAGKP